MKKKLNFKKHFDILKKKDLVFFDNSASTLKPKNVCDAVDFYNRFESVNSGRGVYKLAFEVTSKLERVRKKLANFFDAENYDFVFFKNTSESINQVMLMYVKNILKKDDEILISDLEHNSNFLPWLNLCNKIGAKLVKIATDKNGKMDFDNFKKSVNEKTKFVALSMATNTFGTLLDVQKISEFLNDKNIPFLVDAAQAVAHFKIELDKFSPTFFVFSGYKMFAPTGVGVLAVKKQFAKNLKPVYFGGGAVLEVAGNEIMLKESPQKFEVGSLNISAIIGLGEAIDFLEDVSFDFIKEKETKLKEYFLSQINKIDGFKLYNKNPDLPIFLFNLKEFHAHDVATFYDEFNIMVRAGNHCGILSMEKIKQIATVRVSLNFVNNKKEIDKFVFATKNILKYFD